MVRRYVAKGTAMEEATGFARAVRTGPYVAVGGTAPIGPDGATYGVGDVRVQAERCYEIADDALRRAGASWDDVVRTRTMLTRVDDWREVADVRKVYCKGARPVDTVVEVSRFINPEWLVEIEVDAVLGEDR